MHARSTVPPAPLRVRTLLPRALTTVAALLLAVEGLLLLVAGAGAARLAHAVSGMAHDGVDEGARRAAATTTDGDLAVTLGSVGLHGGTDALAQQAMHGVHWVLGLGAVVVLTAVLCLASVLRRRGDSVSVEVLWLIVAAVLLAPVPFVWAWWVVALPAGLLLVAATALHAKRRLRLSVRAGLRPSRPA